MTDPAPAFLQDRLKDGAGVRLADERIWTALPEDAQSMAATIRSALAGVDAGAAEEVRVLYGGSVKPGNARDLLSGADVDGALVGGASLDAADFSRIAAGALS